MFADAGPAMSGCPPGGVSVPPNATGNGVGYPGSALLAVVTVGAVVPYQLPLNALTLRPGAGSAPPDWRSTTCPYQLPLMLLLLNVEAFACCSGELVPLLASRNRTPTVQLLVISFSTTTVLSVWLRK